MYFVTVTRTAGARKPPTAASRLGDGRSNGGRCDGGTLGRGGACRKEYPRPTHSYLNIYEVSHLAKNIVRIRKEKLSAGKGEPLIVRLREAPANTENTCKTQDNYGFLIECNLVLLTDTEEL
ncbi:hypothetical protein NDU88_000760 [Pleurodeles waltl]|uniref:Uncharacterized protein n=1 Tax=Pleurodeles waltl TaxID=8319 RepID=A0AAV7WKE6_PLEWA|nr:hypothetical protein NDU88_000760 [Pleurodeles waltl]